jgi:hypothetical protein
MAHASWIIEHEARIHYLENNDRQSCMGSGIERVVQYVIAGPGVIFINSIPI